MYWRYGTARGTMCRQVHRPENEVSYVHSCEECFITYCRCGKLQLQSKYLVCCHLLGNTWIGEEIFDQSLPVASLGPIAQCSGHVDCAAVQGCRAGSLHRQALQLWAAEPSRRARACWIQWARASWLCLVDYRTTASDIDPAVSASHPCSHGSARSGCRPENT